MGNRFTQRHSQEGIIFPASGPILFCTQYLPWAFRDWSRVEIGRLPWSCDPHPPATQPGTRGQEETVTQREEPPCSRRTQIVGAWSPKD